MAKRRRVIHYAAAGTKFQREFVPMCEVESLTAIVTPDIRHVECKRCLAILNSEEFKENFPSSST